MNRYIVIKDFEVTHRKGPLNGKGTYENLEVKENDTLLYTLQRGSLGDLYQIQLYRDNKYLGQYSVWDDDSWEINIKKKI